MNSVANQMVATLMNSNFSALQSTSNKPKTANQDFSKVFKQVHNVRDKREDATVAENVIVDQADVKSKPVDEAVNSKDVEARKPIVVDKEVSRPSDQVSEKVSEELEEVSDEMGKEVVSLTSVIDDQENLLAMDEAMMAISELFGIPMEALTDLMEQLDFTVVDLADMGNLTELVQEVFGHEDVGSLLLDQEATQVLKDVKVQVEQLVKDLGIDLSTLKEQLVVERMANENGKKVTEPTKNFVSHIPNDKAVPSQEAEKPEGVKLEVVDMRDAQSTTKYSQKNMNKQDQGSSTFSELMGQNITLTKEVVVQNTVNEIKYQQISTKEVIDQIVTKAVVQLSTGKTSMHLQLNPGHLGKVAVSVTAEQGMVKGQFVAENQVVKEMLESNLIQLKTQLEEQGIKVDKIEVTVGDANQYFNQKDQSNQQESSKKSASRRLARLNALRGIDEIEDVTIQQQPVMQTSLDEHTVEYSA